MAPRRAERDRTTKETSVAVRVDLDGTGQASASTGIPASTPVSISR